MPKYQNKKQKDIITKPLENQRAQLIEEIAVLLKRLDEIKSDLSKPWALGFSLTALPLLTYGLLHAFNLLSFLEADYEAHYMQEIPTFLNDNDLVQDALKKREPHIEVISKFGQQILGMLQKTFTNELLDDMPGSREHLGLRDINNVNTWTLPYRLDDLPAEGDHHMLFRLATFTDEVNLQTDGDGKGVEEGFLVATAAVIRASFNNTRLQGYQNLLACRSQKYIATCAVELLRSFYPGYANFDQLYFQHNIVGNSQELARSHLSYLEYFITIVSTLLLKGLIIQPLTKRYFPISFYLKNPISTEPNYFLMSLESLKKQQKEVSLAYNELKNLANRNNTIAKWLEYLVLLVAFCIFVEAFLVNDYYIFNLTVLPLVVGVLGGRGVEYVAKKHDTDLVNNKLYLLVQKLQAILAKVKNNVEIVSSEYDRLSLSSIAVTVKKPYEGLPREYIADLLKQALNQFGIALLPSYTTTRFSISAQAIIKDVDKIQCYFETLLDHALAIYRLKEQLKTILTNERYRYDIDLAGTGLFSCVFTINLNIQEQTAKASLQELGFQLDAGYIVLYRNKPFDSEDLGKLQSIICRIRQVSRVGMFGVDEFDKNRLHGYPVSQKNEAGPSTIITHPNATKREDHTNQVDHDKPGNIRWPCGASYPGKVKKIQNGTNQYMFWNMCSDDFLAHPQAEGRFESCCERFASSNLGSNGIKLRPTFGTDRLGKQRIFKAHIKVTGSTHGNEGVLLDTEKSGRAELYITRGFSMAIHEKM